MHVARIDPARAGTIIGLTAWAAALTLIAIAIGALPELLPHVIGAWIVSLALAMLVLHAVEQRNGSPVRARLTLAGALLTAIGLLLLIISAWIAPAIDQHPAMQRAMQKLSAGTTRVPDLLSLAVIAAGGLLLILAGRGVSPMPAESPPSHPQA